MAKNPTKMLWNAPKPKGTSDVPKIILADSWSYQHQSETLGMVVITAKAGNKDLALNAYVPDQKLRCSEALLRRRYR